MLPSLTYVYVCVRTRVPDVALPRATRYCNWDGRVRNASRLRFTGETLVADTTFHP